MPKQIKTKRVRCNTNLDADVFSAVNAEARENRKSLESVIVVALKHFFALKVAERRIMLASAPSKTKGRPLAA